MTIPNKFCKNKEWLYDQYVVQKKSYPIIAKELGVQAETVRLWLHRHNIPFRTLSDGKSGELHWNFGNTTPDDVKEKIRQGNIGKVVSQKTKDAISEAMSGENNPRYGVTLSDDQKQRQRSTLLNTYTEHPEIKKQISISRIQYYIDHPNAAQEHSERIKKYYEDPVHRQEQSERLKSFYDNHMLSDEECKERAEHFIKFYEEHPEARKTHSNFMKNGGSPSTCPEVAKKISDSMKKWHAEHPHPVGSAWSVGQYFTQPNGEIIWLRSSYETRYASILNSLGINWKYEPRAFYISTLDSTYRPDFYLPKQDVWIEVKGYLSELDRIKLTEFYILYPEEKLLMVYIGQIKDLEQAIANDKKKLDICRFGLLLRNQIAIWNEEYQTKPETATCETFN